MSNLNVVADAQEILADCGQAVIWQRLADSLLPRIATLLLDTVLTCML